MHRTPTHTTVRRRIAAMRRAGYRGPAYLLGRPAYAYMPRPLPPPPDA